MSDTVNVRLFPLDVTFAVERGSLLRSSLAAYGVDLPCGGARACGGCGIRVLIGGPAVTSWDRDVFSRAELADGWRLACRMRADTDMQLAIGDTATPILTDESPIAGGKRQGLGIAIDLGSTTIAAQLIDRASGAIVGVRTGLNPQMAQGADVMSRVRFALGSKGLTDAIRGYLADMVGDLAAGREIAEVILVGNTVMHHLFAGLDVEPLSHVPFASPTLGEQRFQSRDLGWPLSDVTPIRFLPCLGGFVGSDILAGIVAVDICRDGALRALVDLGTNGEIALGNCDRVLVASTAAGTAFEAGCIHNGMRAASGAIAHVTADTDGRLDCEVIGGGYPQGICGSGLVDAVASGLTLGRIRSSGKIVDGSRTFPVVGEIALWQADVRELQLAKGAIAAGLRILLKHWGAKMADIQTLYLSGAFGSYLRVDSARRIGLLECPSEVITIAGNTALKGAKQILVGKVAPVGIDIHHVMLASDADFEELFVSCMRFPAPEMGEACLPSADQARGAVATRE
ncbi:MAG: ASKHA domain-containing protein [Roseiarcus sp.]|jgi:uncharacterized 2Fe-2S/4Fe-4S cluster protein (DUF4445 family)|uniref:ASKHA domain-containing protein n=1 Tax=Roseiarcus sp. TaxID=1969460 RepID=UPI003C163AC5